MADWIEQPLVSALMVYDRPGKSTVAAESIASFFRQDWPFKELVVFNATDERIAPVWWRRLNYREIKLRPRTPAKMLELCAENADGEWCLNWHPDCVYRADYIRTHMSRRDKLKLVMLCRKQAYSLSENRLAAVTGADIPCWSFYRHHGVDFCLDLQSQFSEVEVIDNPANLVTKFAREIA